MESHGAEAPGSSGNAAGGDQPTRWDDSANQKDLAGAPGGIPPYDDARGHRRLMADGGLSRAHTALSAETAGGLRCRPPRDTPSAAEVSPATEAAVTGRADDIAIVGGPRRSARTPRRSIGSSDGGGMSSRVPKDRWKDAFLSSEHRRKTRRTEQAAFVTSFEPMGAPREDGPAWGNEFTPCGPALVGQA